MKSIIVLAIAMLMALGTYAQAPTNQSARSGSVIVIMEGRTAVNLDPSLCKNVHLGIHQFIVLDEN